jgi:hypothetical protein
VESGHLAEQPGRKLEKAAMFLAHGIQPANQAEITDALSISTVRLSGVYE